MGMGLHVAALWSHPDLPWFCKRLTSDDLQEVRTCSDEGQANELE